MCLVRVLSASDRVTPCYTQLLTATGAEHGVLKFDHCHKPAKKIRLSDSQSKPCMGTAWALNGNSEIMGFYHVSSTSLYELRVPLRELSIRCLRLGKPIQVVYVDNAAQTHQVWRKLLVTDRPGGVMVKQDTYHLKRRFMEAVPRSHKLYNSFSSDLSALLLPIYPPDVERLKGIDAVSLRRKARKFVPPGSGRDVLLAVQSLLNRYKALDGGNHFITPAVEKVLNDQWSLVKDGNDMISDPYPINLMYYIDPATKQYRSIRTTSQVENLNRRFNALLQGCVLPGLADALILDFAGRNNIDQALRAGRGLGLPESMYNLYLASRLNKCVPAGLSLPFPAWAKIEQLAAAGVVERFGFKWQEQLAVEAILEASAETTMPEVPVVLDDEDGHEPEEPPPCCDLGAPMEEWDTFLCSVGSAGPLPGTSSGPLSNGQAASGAGPFGNGQAASGAGPFGNGQAASGAGPFSNGQAASGAGPFGNGQAASGAAPFGNGQAASGAAPFGNGQAASGTICVYGTRTPENELTGPCPGLTWHDVTFTPQELADCMEDLSDATITAAPVLPPSSVATAAGAVSSITRRKVPSLLGLKLWQAIAGAEAAISRGDATIAADRLTRLLTVLGVVVPGSEWPTLLQLQAGVVSLINTSSEAIAKLRIQQLAAHGAVTSDPTPLMGEAQRLQGLELARRWLSVWRGPWPPVCRQALEPAHTLRPSAFDNLQFRAVESPTERALFAALALTHGRNYEAMAKAWCAQLTKQPQLAAEGVTMKNAKLLADFDSRTSAAVQQGLTDYQLMLQAVLVPSWVRGTDMARPPRLHEAEAVPGHGGAGGLPAAPVTLSPSPIGVRAFYTLQQPAVAAQSSFGAGPSQLQGLQPQRVQQQQQQLGAPMPAMAAQSSFGAGPSQLQGLQPQRVQQQQQQLGAPMPAVAAQSSFGAGPSQLQGLQPQRVQQQQPGAPMPAMAAQSSFGAGPSQLQGLQPQRVQQQQQQLGAPMPAVAAQSSFGAGPSQLQGLQPQRVQQQQQQQLGAPMPAVAAQSSFGAGPSQLQGLQPQWVQQQQQLGAPMPAVAAQSSFGAGPSQLQFQHGLLAVMQGTHTSGHGRKTLPDRSLSVCDGGASKKKRGPKGKTGPKTCKTCQERGHPANHPYNNYKKCLSACAVCSKGNVQVLVDLVGHCKKCNSTFSHKMVPQGCNSTFSHKMVPMAREAQ
ncbi:hypothetical protein PLESTB_000646300 [Pleodorina starrii]|uniref:Uncharacterized protein n=1 Tax=Pleodorina starrii TaxID=330485 RepID=A0A9W6F0W9_9CHLO|nr:hypothetical protein PLESTB_000646300 [Pleodorina starrii]GLC71593.1 hypothetical protein PLESTF_001138900 [Pleodorina starrii]